MGLCPCTEKYSLEEEGAQPSVGKYSFAAEGFVSEHPVISLFGHRGALTEVGDVIGRLRSSLIRCMRSGQDVYHIFVYAQHFESFGILRHQTSREPGKQEELCLPFRLKLEAPYRNGF